jgi:aryl-alcohol dehydrogenase-like predicted oxidoreductase
MKALPFYETACSNPVVPSAQISGDGDAARLVPTRPILIKTYKIANTDLVVSQLGYRSFYSGNSDRGTVDPGAVADAEGRIHAAYEAGITFFDHADVYDFGGSEAAFGQVLKRSPDLRDRIVIQSKYGAYLASSLHEPSADDPHHVDLSYAHIMSSVEGSLQRLSTGRLDLLLFARKRHTT